MPKLRYVVDIGSSHTSIYHNGPLLTEATAAFVQRSNGLELIAAGNTAFKYHPDPITKRSLVTPVKDGIIVYPKVATLILKEFFKRSFARTLFKGIEIIVPISTGLTDLEKETFETTICKTGYSDVTLVECVKGLVPVINRTGQLVIIIGEGLTEIAVMLGHDIIAACSVNLCGADLDEKIINAVENQYEAIISAKSAELLRINIGSLYDGDISAMEVYGRDIIGNRVKPIIVKAECIKEPIYDSYIKIVEVAEKMLNAIPLRILNVVAKHGVYLAGSGAQIYGLSDFMRKHLQIPVTCDPDPKTAVARGLYSMEISELI
ncbi:MAG: rod shape-determining protein [Christensenellaceae bacterium]|jgi:rod shape-determining protein MreB|nr:rod shape-determining protein [Christensenellaceae bacterium]